MMDNMTPIGSDEREVLACPWCGKEAETFMSHRLCARCPDADCLGHGGGSQWYWIEKWNRRAAVPAPVREGVTREDVEALRVEHVEGCWAIPHGGITLNCNCYARHANKTLDAVLRLFAPPSPTPQASPTPESA